MIMGGFLEILKQTFKILLKNGKLILFITILFALANSTISLSFLFSVKFILNNFSNKIMNLVPVSTNPTSPELSPNITFDDSYFRNVMSLMKQRFRLFALANSAFVFAASFVSLLFATATILVSAENFLSDYKLNAKEIVPMTLRSWRRTVLTSVYTTLLSLGYTFFVIVFVVLPLDPIFMDPTSMILGKFPPLTVIIVVLAMILYFYLFVVWNLAIVVSVLEEKSGFEALWKASVLVKGLKRKGFLLNLLFGGLYLAVFLVWKAIFSRNLGIQVQVMIGVKILPTIVSISITTLIGVFSMISFTVLYFEGKKMNEGSIIKMRGNVVEYSKVPASASLFSSDIP